MGEYPDVQGLEVSEGFKISRVGVKGIKREVKIARPDRVVHLVPTFDISVDLPAEQKGSHMSRHVEVINRAIDMVIGTENQSLEGLVEFAARIGIDGHTAAYGASDVLRPTDPQGLESLAVGADPANHAVRPVPGFPQPG